MIRQVFQSSKRHVLKASQLLSKMKLDETGRIVAKGRTFSVQYSLPRLPVPPLEQTLNRYLETCRPLLDDQQFEATSKIVKQFKDKEGPELQKMLEERATHHTNWLSEWWKNIAYLESRLPCVLVNPGLHLPKRDFKGKQGQIDFTAQLLAGLLDFRMLLDEQGLPVDMMGGKPLCMAQHYELLNACRIPGLKKDTHVCTGPTDPNQPKHITLIHKNHIFSMNIFGSQGKPLSVSQLREQIQSCVDQSQVPAEPVGILTTMDRSSWGKAYHDMVKDKTNRASLEDIQKSICVVSLDGVTPELEGLQEIDVAAGISLNGGGSKLYSSNRWFDKTIQLTIGEDGTLGTNYEHTTAEGPAVIGLLDHIMGFIEKNKEGWLAAPGVEKPKRLQFNLTDKTREVMARGMQDIESINDDLMVRSLVYTNYGKGFIKKCKLSPDAYIQVAFQLAYHRLYNQPCATYESGSLRQFQLGRTDTIRSCSSASLAFSQAMDDTAVPVTKKVELLKEAVSKHRTYTNYVVSGQAVDRHLLGLKLSALEAGRDIPQIFMDLAFKESTHFKLSTSQVASQHALFLCFVPVVPDGYGLCYNPQEERIVACVTSYNNSPETDSAKLVKSISQAFTDMQTILASQTHAKL